MDNHENRRVEGPDTDHLRKVAAFHALVERAVSVRIVDGSSFDYRKRSHHTQLASDSSEDGMATLRSALQVSLVESDFAFTTPGRPTLALFGPEGQFLLAVTYLSPGFIRSDALETDTPLAAPEHLSAWLAQRGCYSDG